MRRRRNYTMLDDEKKDLYCKIESMLFVAGDPVPVSELARALDISTTDARQLLQSMEEDYKGERRGILPMITDTTAQLITNGLYSPEIKRLLQPEQTKGVSKSLMETLAVVAYKQPVTRADIEAVRGVRCEYAVSQLLQLGLIETCGKKDTLGHPTLFQTTDLFLRKFGLHNREELPEYFAFSETPNEEEAELPTV